MEVALGEAYSLKFFGCDQGIHLVLERDGQPYVCRKSRLGEIRKMTGKETDHLFKGRLQLQLSGQSIEVIASKQSVGAFPVGVLQEAVHAAAGGELPWTS